jgi:translation initiation factor 2 subunit 2
MESQYTTDELIDRLYENLDSKNNKTTNNKLIIEPPILSQQNKKTLFSNFRSTCDNLNRNELDVKKFIDDELCCSSSINGTGGMVIDGRFRSKNLEKPLINYINTYVICKECHNKKTDIIKKDRISFLKCNKCLSEKAIQT